MSSENGINYQDLLRKIPLYNSYGTNYPKQIPPKLELHEIVPLNYKLQPLPPLNEIFDPWIEQCDKLLNECKEYKEEPRKFEEFYFKKYLSQIPPSLLDRKVLSPNKISPTNNI
ncbi:ubiquitin-binding ESCRT-I subunit protein MVB12 PWA37_000309 [Arxiozyma heterogenica]|uniref:Multivesicular body sorting factor 12 domain-containing protein n=1 Tax=Arxiozyma heterogenica TaxID=278026 RepID=A0AAN7WM42_9SACH|nr:hypothetical protein RI543_004102 [Kazachstania heterogenica]